uniref:Uncharacterized protein n=1 Tax=Avena sativa TaxID=4498 RepID=A0ACD5VCR7_AVESA
MDRRHAGEFVVDVVLWRRGRAEVSALALAATVSSWILLGAGGGYTAVSLSSNVLLLLLAVLFAWSKAARLLNRPPPPVPDLQPAVDELTSLLHSALTGLSSTFRRVALADDPASGALFRRVAICLAAASILGGLAGDLPTFCYAAAVAALTVPALYERCFLSRYARLACLNLYRYELVYQSFSHRCYLSARDYLIELLKEP